MKYYAGLDGGTFGAELVILDRTGEIVWKGRETHHGNLRRGAEKLADRAAVWFEKEKGISRKEFMEIPGKVTGSGWKTPQKAGDIPAIRLGAGLLYPQAGSVIMIGAQNACFLTGLEDGKAFSYSTNEGCAGGTGAFFEDQMQRLGLELEDYSSLTEQAASIPRLSGRCSVFAKTDLIHRQQEGVPAPDILLGLCYGAVRNYKAVIVRELPVEKPVVLGGGVIRNSGVIRAVKDLFDLKEGELIADAYGEYLQAAGAAKMAAKEDGCREEIPKVSRKDEGKELRSLGECLEYLKQEEQGESGKSGLRKLSLFSKKEDRIFEELKPDLLAGGTWSLGIDVGSTSTNLVVTDAQGRLLDSRYLRTRGNPRAAVKEGLCEIKKRFGEAFEPASIAVTGSGRYLIGKELNAGLIVDEITAQAKAASFVYPQADTVFEIGGQDSKYIRLSKGEVRDFQMNKICAAGTGSFLEEQAGRLKVPVEKYGEMALASETPANLGERCTVFIESSINACLAAGRSREDILAGLCYSVIGNYLHKVVGNRPVGEQIVLQGGVCYNPAVVAAFRSVYGDRLKVSPYFSVSGAYGAALLGAEQMEKGVKKRGQREEWAEFHRKSRDCFYGGYVRKEEREPRERPVVGIPYVLLVHKFFPMFRNFFEELGCEVLLSPETGEEIIALAQIHSRAETCYPVKLIYGHMAWLAKRRPDYIFLPSILTMKHEVSKVHHNYGCVYMQTAPGLVFGSMNLKEQGIELLNPVFHLDFGQKAMAEEMIAVGSLLGHSPEKCRQALMKGAMAVRQASEKMEALGRQLLEKVGKEEKVLVMVTRNYGIEDPVLNMGIPEELRKRGYPVLTLSHLPAHDLDISEDYDNMYWPFGQHILSGAKIIAANPNLYGIYLTNHGCGPDTMLAHLFAGEMGDKPYLHIEVDEHFSKVGVITRIEAFLHSLEHREENKEACGIEKGTRKIQREIPKDQKLYLPPLGPYSRILEEKFCEAGYEAQAMEPFNQEDWTVGRSVSLSKEYLSFVLLAGRVLREARAFGEIRGHEIPFSDEIRSSKETGVSDRSRRIFLPQTEGGEADGSYARVIEKLLAKSPGISLVSPLLETLPWEMEASLFETAFEGILEGDRRLLEESKRRPGRRILFIGDPLLVYNEEINGNLTLELEKQGFCAVLMPMAEYLLSMWIPRAETPEQKAAAERCLQKMEEIFGEEPSRGRCRKELTALLKEGRKILPVLTGGGGLYRAAKRAVSRDYAGILELSSMYENVQTILDLTTFRGSLPVLSLKYEGGNTDEIQEKIRSFLYFLK